MKAVNKVFKFFGYVAVYTLTFLHCYVLSLLASGSLLSVVCAILSIVMELPAILTERFWLVYLTASIPIAVILFVVVVTDVSDKKGGFKKAI